MRKTILLSLLMVCLTAGIVSAAKPTPMKKGPYLIYPGVNDEMMVLWQVKATETGTLEWGEDTSYSSGSVQTTEFGSDHQHEHVITGLTPGVKYYYRVTEGGGSHTGSFFAAPADVDIGNLKFLAYGDTRSNPRDQDDVTGAMIAAYTADPAYQTVTLLSGDWVNSNSESEYTNQYFKRSYANNLEFMGNMPVAGPRGNHEGSASVFRKYFPFPYVNNHYWSFDYGPVHFIVLDNFTDYSVGSTQYNWLVNDLASTTKEWKIITVHEPAWGSGDHSNNTTMQARIQPLCLTYGVNLMIYGHNHNYVRCLVDGVHHVTTGGGGASLDGVNSGDPYVVIAESTLNYCTIDIQGLDLTLTSFRIPENTVIESFTIQRTPPIPPDPATNPNPADTATDVSLAADISWDAGAYATSHDVYFGTDSTPDAGEFAGNQTPTTYDPGILNEYTTYYWAIDEVNFTGTTPGPVWSFTTGEAEFDPPTPDPASFASAPVAINSVAISMTATTGSDASGPVEYLFTETSGNPGGDSSNWQTSTSYTDSGLSQSTQYTYTVTMRDGMGNTGAASGAFSATTPDFSPIYINFQPAASAVPAGYLVDAGDNFGDRGNGYSYGWDGDNLETRQRTHADQRYATLNHLQKSGADATWEIEIPNGTYDVDVVFGDPDFADQTNDMNVEGIMLDDPDGQDNFDEHFGVIVVVSDGRLTVSAQGSAVNSKICYIDILVVGGPAETDPPTPDPATFAVAPTAISETAISMTSTTGTDVSGPVQYYFDATDGGNDSGWQTSTSYTDTGLAASTQYTYTVQMRDGLSNTGTASGPASATTDAGCAAGDMHIEDVVCAKVGGCSRGMKKGQATVTIYDDCGNPVANALVDGTFGGDYSETIYDVVTDANGQAVLTTSGCAKKPSFSFTVDDVTGPLPYDSNDDLTTGCSG